MIPFAVLSFTEGSPMDQLEYVYLALVTMKSVKLHKEA